PEAPAGDHRRAGGRSRGARRVGPERARRRSLLRDGPGEPRGPRLCARRQRHRARSRARHRDVVSRAGGMGPFPHPPSPFPGLSYVPRMKIGLVQMAMAADPDANLANGVAKVREAARAGAQIVCLPELFRSRYFAQREDPAQFGLAEPVPGPSTQALAAVARDAWRTVQRGHAIANGVYVAAVNRVGLERPAEGDGGDGIEFWGTSFVADPLGVVIAEAPVDRETILYAEVDPGRLEEVRHGWPFLRDRRIDAYGGITARFLDDPS